MCCKDNDSLCHAEILKKENSDILFFISGPADAPWGAAKCTYRPVLKHVRMYEPSRPYV